MDERTLKMLYDEFKSSEQRSQALTGNRYYRNKNDIEQRKLFIYTEGGVIEDPYKSNNKVPTSYYKYVIDQKINYLLGQKYTSDSEEITALYKDVKTLGKYASIKGVQWAFMYPQNNEIKLKIIPTEQLYPIYEDDKLIMMVRFYNMGDNAYSVVYTDNEEITFKDFKHVNTKSHMVTTRKIGTLETSIDVNINMIPFIPMFNNDAAIYDLEPIKPMIDIVDVDISDFANNLEDFQDVYWILKNYNGQDIASFTEEVKRYKTLRVGQGGDASAQTINIPHEARMKMIELMDKLIYKFSFSVDVEKMSGDALTNVAIKALFMNLDMKCNMFGQEIQEFIDRYVEMYNMYARVIGISTIEADEVKFTKTTIVNESEALEDNSKQIGVVSDETRLANHSWVTDVEEELRLMSGYVTIDE